MPQYKDVNAKISVTNSTLINTHEICHLFTQLPFNY